MKGVEGYLVHDAIFTLGYESTDIEIAKQCQMSLKALDVNAATISVDKYHRFYEHMSKRHSSQVGRDLAWALFGHRDEGTLTVSSRFKMPYHSGYGLVMCGSSDI